MFRVDKVLSKCEFCKLEIRLENKKKRRKNKMRTVSTIVTAHTLCASRDTWVSYGLCLLIQEYFHAVKN